MGNFTAIFQPGNIGSLKLDNRLIMNAMGTVLTDGQSNPTQRTYDYYAARARGGAGLITTQCMAVSRDAATPWELAVYDDSFIPGLKNIVDAIHQNGSKVSVQLMHYGLLLTFSGFIPEGMTVKVPSIISWLKPGRPYTEVSEQDIDRYVEDFAQAARRAKQAGADAVELHACHGCLVSTFMSPITNRRTDLYGGSIENRILLARRIVERIKEVTGKGFPLIVKINATDDLDGGVTIDEAMQQAKALEQAGADAISVSSGLEFWASLSIPPYHYPEGPLVPLAEKMKEAVSLPVSVAGKISPELGERLVGDGKMDFIGMGRPLLADPELPNKLRDGRVEEVRWCVYCNNCIRTDPGLGPCSVNPSLYREGKYPFPPTNIPKKVMVIGGGLAGMQAALLLARRGHYVTLYERNSELGGQWNIAASQPGKEHYSRFTEYLKRSLSKEGVPVKMGVVITREKVIELQPDAVVIATGASPAVLNIPGATGRNVVQANDIITGKAQATGKVVIIGGRFIGMEVAIMLAERGQSVSLATLRGLGENGSKLEGMTLRSLVRRLIDLRVPLYIHTTAVEITDDKVVIGWGDDIFSLPADTVVMAVGARPNNGLARELEDIVAEVYTIGDCDAPRDAAAATYQAARLAAKI